MFLTSTYESLLLVCLTDAELRQLQSMPWPSWWSSTKRVEQQEEEQKPKSSLHNLSSSIRETTSQAISAATTATSSGAGGNGNNSDYSSLKQFTQPETLLAAAVLTSVTLVVLRVYRKTLLRIPDAPSLPQTYFRRPPARPKSILGKVTSVGDGDNFRLYHTPGGWLAGWGWLPWRRVPKDRKALKNQTVCCTLSFPLKTLFCASGTTK